MTAKDAASDAPEDMLTRLMAINAFVVQSHIETEAEVLAGETVPGMLEVYHALRTILADLAVRAAATPTMTRADIKTLVETRGAATLDYNEYDACRLLTKWFSADHA